jgi:hypothetical protein
MAAKARVTVRLAPSSLHALAYLAEREGYTPAEIAREIIAAGVLQTLAARGWQTDWRGCWAAWCAEQGARPARYEVPAQEDYDALALGRGFPATPQADRAVLAAAAARRPLADQVAAESAHIRAVAAARAQHETRR